MVGVLNADASHLAPQPLPTSKHLFGVVYQQMVWADVRNARALPTSKMKVKVLSGSVLT